MVTIEQLQRAKNQALEARDEIIKAEATMKEVNSAIEEKRKELKELGVNPDSVDEDIEKLQGQIDKLYDSVKEKLDKIPL